MSDLNKTEVLGSGDGVVSKQEPTPAPSAGGVSPQVEKPVETPTQSPVDVEALRTKYEQDINNLKSSLQRQTAQVEKQWRDRYATLEREYQRNRMKNMTEEERAEYERQLENEEFENMQRRMQELEQQNAQQVATLNAYNFFIQQGVPPTAINIAEGYDAIVSAGWQYLTSELARLRQVASNPQPQRPPEPEPLKPAPEVVTDKGLPAPGTTWNALRAQYGTDEAVYRAVEEGRLPASVIPTTQ